MLLSRAAAHQAIISFGWIRTMIYQGVGAATTALTGKRLGAKEEAMAERTGYVAWKVSMCFVVVLGGVLFLFSRSIMRVFLPTREYNIEAIRIGAQCLKILAFVQIPKAISVIFSASLRAAGDVRWLLFANIVGTTIGEVILAHILGLGIVMTSGLVKFGLPGIWLGMLTGESIRAALNYRRYRKGRWKKIEV